MSRPWTITGARRREAVEACDQMASSNDVAGIMTANNIQSNVVAKPPIYALASAAFDAVYTIERSGKYSTLREVWAEAAQLLRDGWTPGNTIISMSEVLEKRADAKVKEIDEALNAAGVPADAETLEFVETEGRVIDEVLPTDEALVIPKLVYDNATRHSEEDHTLGCTERCVEPECPLAELIGAHDLDGDPVNEVDMSTVAAFEHDEVLEEEIKQDLIESGVDPMTAEIVANEDKVSDFGNYGFEE